MSMEMDFLRRSARCSRLEKIGNNVIRKKNEYKKFCFRLHKIQTVKLVWPRAIRMDQEMFPRRILEWWPPGRRRKGRPRNSWMQEVTTGTRERGISDLERVDREGWRKKIN